MRKIFQIGVIAITLVSMVGCSGCSKKENKDKAAEKGEVEVPKQSRQDIIAGTLNVVVDEVAYPLLKEQEEIFLSSYPNARLNVIKKPELLAVRELLSNEANVAVLARKLNEIEADYFSKRSIKPRVFPVWTDAIVVVGHTKTNDTTVTIGYLLEAMRGKSSDKKKIVFDNLNGSTLRYFKELGEMEKIAANFVEEQAGSEKVLEAVASDPNKIGILGYHVYSNLISSFPRKDNIRILSVQNTLGEQADGLYYRPTQSTIAAEKYPLRQTFYVQNYQPKLGVGIGFSAFLTGDRGQRIVLKSGLVPATMPGRDIIIRDDIAL